MRPSGHPLTDAAFDRCLPEEVQGPSHRHWTPVDLACLGAQWLAEAGARRVLDFGAGAGKFCVVGALATDLDFLGIEQRPHLVHAARRLAATFGVASRVTFQEGGFEALEAEPCEALYVYNPFGENLLGPQGHLDGTVELNRRRFDRETTRLEAWLAQRPPGTWMLTLNGFGGRIPDTYDLVRIAPTEVAPLRLWRRARRPAGGGHWLELEEGTLRRGPGDREELLPVEA